MPEWLQDLRENLVDESVPEYTGAPVSSSREPLIEPVMKEESGKRRFILTSRKTRIARYARGPKLQGLLARNAHEKPSSEINFGEQIRKFLSENCESQKITDTLSWYKIWQFNGFNQIRTSQETEKSLQKFLVPKRKPKVIYTDTSMEFGKACEHLSLESLYVDTSPFRFKRNC